MLKKRARRNVGLLFFTYLPYELTSFRRRGLLDTVLFVSDGIDSSNIPGDKAVASAFFLIRTNFVVMAMPKLILNYTESERRRALLQ
jgi:hypothetical protein